MPATKNQPMQRPYRISTVMHYEFFLVFWRLSGVLRLHGQFAVFEVGLVGDGGLAVSGILSVESNPARRTGFFKFQMIVSISLFKSCLQNRIF